MCCICFAVLYFQYVVDTMCKMFMFDDLDTHQGLPRCIHRNSVYESVLTCTKESWMMS